TVEAGGGSVRVVSNLGQIYSRKGDYPRAEFFFRKALKLSPTYLIAKNNLADALYQQGKGEEAEQIFHEAAAAKPEARKGVPRSWVVPLNLANLRVGEYNFSAALDILAEARCDYPDVWPLIALESEALRKTRGPAAALPAVQDYARRYWWHLPSQMALGKLYWEEGDLAQAEATFRLATRLDVHDVSALNMTALISVNQTRFEEACVMQRRAIARQPDEPRQYLILSDILVKMGRSEEARAMVAQASRLQALVQTQSAAL
ncbi:MAG: tetratricopeptide repeat protein, partial [Verrucomicrobiota bacterium]|nr:tetratricopeptide repeat protein [Verrucomicrobiota bacterium]